MAPYAPTAPTGHLYETDQDIPVHQIIEQTEKISQDERDNQRTVWSVVIIISILHAVGPYGFYAMFMKAKIWTSVFAIFMYQAGVIGTTAGAHRLWSHRSYKAKWQLRLLLAIMQTSVFVGPVLSWARDHRVHHKYTDTDADPYNAKRGFYFCHIGWIFKEKHPDVIAKGDMLDCSDLYADPIITFQKKYYLYLVIPMCFILPTILPIYLWNETIITSFSVNIFRHVFCLHTAFSGNSFAHYFGTKPYDRHVTAVQNIGVSIITLGDGWHNYHHAFPWDYRSSEFGNFSSINIIAAFIDMMSRIGWSYDLKTASKDIIKKRIIRTGDGTHGIWGWGDEDQLQNERNKAIILSTKMAPYATTAPTGHLYETDQDIPVHQIVEQTGKTSQDEHDSRRTAWSIVIILSILHAVGPYGFYAMFMKAKIWTSVFAIFMYQAGVIGTTAGAHRLWSHRSYKAKWQLRLLLVILQTNAFIGPVISWARDHRVHHKYTDTDADPYNAKRGFYFCHIGWIFKEKHADVIAKGDTLDCSDLYADPIIAFQKKYYYYLIIPVCFILPTILPIYLWNETFITSVCVNIFRHLFFLHSIFSANSFAHYFGTEPYERNVTAVQNIGITILTMGDGWHNYHHAFPWDYRSSEFGNFSSINIIAAFIELMSKIGWSYDLKTASKDIIKKRIIRTGDGTHEIWGWGDKDQPQDERNEAIVLSKKNL